MTLPGTDDFDELAPDSTAGKSPLKWILLAAIITLIALIYFKDSSFFQEAPTPLFNPPAKSEQQLEKEKSKSAEENKLKEKF